MRQRRRTDRGALTGALAAALLLAGCVGGDGRPSPPTQSGPGEVVTEASTDGPPTATPGATAPIPTATAPPDDVPSPEGTGVPRDGLTLPSPADVPVRDATAGLAAVVAEPPVRIVYQPLGVDMDVVPVGIAEDGQMEIPYDAAQAGWYEFGPTAGADQGTTVIAAHAGSNPTPRGPFYDLPDAEVGDEITVTLADGAAVTYAVVSVESVPKDVIDMSIYFRRSGQPELVLFTCGGRWDDARQSYDDNVVVIAAPVG